MDWKFYKYIFGNYPERRTVRHHYIPCHNLISKSQLNANNMTDLNDSFPYYKPWDYVTDVSTVILPGSGCIDRSYKLVSDKQLWEEGLQRAIPKNIKGSINYLNKIKSGKVVEANAAVEKYLEYIKHDPEPNFEGTYNWLYTDGNIAGFPFSEYYVLLTGNDICGSPVLNMVAFDSDFKQATGEIFRKDEYYMKHPSPIYQISCCNKTDLFMVATRQKEEITVFKFNGAFEKEASSFYNNTGMTWTSMDINVDATQLATADFYEIGVYNVETEQKMFKHKLKLQSVQWGQIIFASNNSVYLADPYSLNIIDLRVPCEVNFIYKPKAVTNDCELICNLIKRDCCDNTLFIATSHSLIEVDMRNRKEIQKWTHLMKSPPQFGKAVFRENQEIVLLQSEMMDELVAITNKKSCDDEPFISKSSPYAITTVKHEWSLAKQNGMCYHPCMTERFDFAITGLEAEFISKNPQDGPYIFTINGGCDVVMTKLRQKQAIASDNNDFTCKEDALENLRKFEAHCVNLHSEPLIADKIIDMSSLLKEIENPRCKKIKKRKKRDEEVPWRYSEMYSYESLSFYKDLIGKEVLRVWGINPKDSEDDFDPEIDLDDSFCKNKVMNWIKSTNDSSDVLS